MVIDVHKLLNKTLWLLTVLFFFLSMTISYIMEGSGLGKYVLLGIMLLTAGLCAIDNRFVISLNIRSIHIYMVMFTVMCLCSVFWADNRSIAMNRAMDILEMTVMVFIFYPCFSKDDSADRLISAIMWINYLVVFYGVYYYGWDQIKLIADAGGRVENDAINANVLGMCSAYAILISIYYMYYQKKKWLLLALALPTLVVLGATGSKKALIILAAGILMLMVLKALNTEKTFNVLFKFLGIIFILAAAVLVASRLAIFKGLFERFEHFINAYSGMGVIDHSTEARMELVDIGIQIFTKNPLLGIGIDNARLYTLKIESGGEYLHNNYIAILVNLGLGVLAAYYWFYIRIFRSYIRNWSLESEEFRLIFTLFIIFIVMDIGRVSYETKMTYLYLILFFSQSEKESCLEIE